jgi:hypothetical protein
MSLLTEHIIPGNHGKVFQTNAKKDTDLLTIKKELLSLKGVKDIVINNEVFPRELKILTNALVKVEDIEQKAVGIGFHVIPKGLLKL